MNKFFNFIKHNKVLFALIVVIVFCLIVIGIFGFKLLWGETGTTNYGTRLDDIIELNKEESDKIKLYFLNDENVNTVTLKVQGKIIYITIDFKSDYKLSKAKKLVVSSFENMSEKILQTYDIQYILTASNVEESKYYPFMGYKASSKEEISWLNR